ncbi:hypothetical protein GCM10010336_34270 [Streptomyces goshikiensis]|nr:hypothetical protein GCM10010336_34270 [Streptomyces goshikiensis]
MLMARQPNPGGPRGAVTRASSFGPADESSCPASRRTRSAGRPRAPSCAGGAAGARHPAGFGQRGARVPGGPEIRAGVAGAGRGGGAEAGARDPVPELLGHVVTGEAGVRLGS